MIGVQFVMKWLFISVLAFLAVVMSVFAISMGEFVGLPLVTLVLTVIFIFDLLCGR